MTPSPVDIGRFGGLNLAAEPFDIGLNGAVDLLNVDFDWPGRFRTRDGTAQWNNTTLTAVGYSALYGSSEVSGGVLFAVRYPSAGSVAIDQITTAGVTTNIGSFAGAANTFPLSHVDFGAGTVAGSVSVFSFVTQPGTGVQSRGYPNPDGTGGVGTFSGGKPLYVGVTSVSNRLIQAGFFAAADSPSGANGSRSTVFFSDPGVIGTYGANNFVTLRPGDGEVITGVVTFGNETYVFKQSSVFVFYGESIDSQGNPTFNYRRMDLPEPLSDPVSNAPFSTYTVAAADGIYYSTSGGVWRLTPGGVGRFSAAVNKVFSRDPTVSSALENGSSTPPRLSYASGKLFAAYTNGVSAPRQLVFDPRFGQWSLYDLPAFGFAEYPAGASTFRDALYYVRGAGNNNVFVQRPTSTDDSGVAIPWSWTSGFGDVGTQNAKALKWTDVAGYGNATVLWTPEGGRPSDVVPAAGALVLGTKPTIATARYRASVRGRRFQLKVSGSGQAAVSEVVPYLEDAGT